MSHVDTAQTLVLGDRNEDYGTPADDFGGCALIWTGLLRKILQTGKQVTPELVALMMAGLKLNREVHRPKADNIVDAHGYLICHEWIATGKKPTSQAQIVEDIACGSKLACFKCGKSLPCMCEHEKAGAVAMPTPGEGYRWLEIGEIVQGGDQYFDENPGVWANSVCTPSEVTLKFTYRRRIT